MSREELFQQFGRLQATVQSMEQAATFAERRERALRSENGDLQQEKSDIVATVSELREALAVAKADVERLRESLNAAEGRCSALIAQKVQMEKTIKVQSEQISKKPEVNNTTPHRHNPAAQPFLHSDAVTVTPDPRSAIHSQPPPSYKPRRTQPSSSYAPPPLLHHQSSTIRASITSSQDAHAPLAVAHQQGFGAQLPGKYGKASGSTMHHDLAAEMGALVLQDGQAVDVDFPAEFQQLFALTESWARNYANVPDAARDQALPESLKNSFMQLSHASLAQGLISSGSTRYFLVAKILNNYFTTEVLRIGLIKGISPAHDARIGNAKGQIRPNMPDHIRRALVLAIADTVKEIRALPEFDAWLKKKVTSRATALWSTLSTMLVPGADTAWEDFKYLISEAHRLSLDMSSLPLSYSFEYPKVGPHTFFDPSSMLNRDPTFKGDPISLKRQQLKVKLGITPVVVTTDMMGSAIVPKTVHFANVLLMQ